MKGSFPVSGVWASLALSSAMYATGYVVARFIDPSAGAWTFTVQSSFFTWLTMAIFARGSALARPSAADWAAIAFNGLAGPVTVYLIMLGSMSVTPALSSIIVISNVLFIALFAWALGRKRFVGIQGPALAAGFAGVAYIGASRGALQGEAMGAACLILAAVFIATSTIVIERPMNRLGWAPVARWVSLISAVSSAAALQAQGGFHYHSAGQTAAAMVMGILSLGAPGILYSRGMSLLGSADSAVFKLLIPFFSLVYGAAVFRELPDVGAFMGGALVAVSLGLYHHSGRREEKGQRAEDLAGELS